MLERNYGFRIKLVPHWHNAFQNNVRKYEKYEKSQIFAHSSFFHIDNSTNVAQVSKPHLKGINMVLHTFCTMFVDFKNWARGLFGRCLWRLRFRQTASCKQRARSVTWLTGTTHTEMPRTNTSGNSRRGQESFRKQPTLTLFTPETPTWVRLRLINIPLNLWLYIDLVTFCCVGSTSCFVSRHFLFETCLLRTWLTFSYCFIWMEIFTDQNHHVNKNQSRRLFCSRV